ncbi:hypothetical protein ACTD5D_02275 [Nocardia takedensis]|uniref:hypothetical protein n=1 Tax=Nocardia TaxID=1817 RepID=UPI002458A82D|nr:MULTISPECIES: hypothetical protein [Nocardia]
MTTPPPAPGSRESVVQWQAQLLSQIRLLTGEHTRILGAGWEGFEPLDSGGDAESAWRKHLDALSAERERVEQTALSAGVRQEWIDDAVALGENSARPRVDALSRLDSMPWRDNAAQGFFVGMLGLDLWHLERMAALAAERDDRVATGRWSYGKNPISEKQFAQNMELRHERVVALAHAAQITEDEADMLWGDAAEPYRRDHAVRLEIRDELSVARAWHSYTKPSTELSVPPYVPTDPATGTPIVGAHTLPPTPQQMIAAAAATLRAEFINAALAGTDVAADTTTALGAISAAVDDALPAEDTGLAIDPDLGPDPDSDGGYRHDYGTDP